MNPCDQTAEAAPLQPWDLPPPDLGHGHPQPPHFLGDKERGSDVNKVPEALVKTCQECRHPPTVPSKDQWWSSSAIPQQHLQEDEA